jgi:hypothetical protein
VNNGDSAGLVKMRMGIDIGRRPVRGPARMGDAKVSGRRFGFQQAREAFINPPLFLAQTQITIPHHGDARAVITAIFQPPQSFQQDGRDFFFADVSNDATHKFLSANYTNYRELFNKELA